MAEQIYGFTYRDAETLIRMGRRFKSKHESPGPELPFDHRGATVHVYIAKTPAGGIAARSGITLSKEECRFWYVSDIDELTEGEAGSVYDVYNPYWFDLPGEIFVDAVREVLSGKLLASVKGGFAAVIATEITARSGTTPGSGTATLYKIDDSTGLYTSLAKTPTVYNTSQAVGSVGKYIQVKIDHSGRLLWDVDDCAA